MVLWPQAAQGHPPTLHLDLHLVFRDCLLSTTQTVSGLVDNCAVVLVADSGLFLQYWNDGGRLKASWGGGLCQGQVED